MKVAEIELLRDALASTANGRFDDHDGVWDFDGHTVDEYRNIVTRAAELVVLQGTDNTTPAVQGLARCLNDLKPWEKTSLEMHGMSIQETLQDNQIYRNNLPAITPELIEQERQERAAPLALMKPIAFRRTPPR